MSHYIHNYQIIEKIGKGAFATVFKGVHRINEKEVAIKVSKERQIHESKILAYLNREHANSLSIPTLYWYGLFGENTCIAMSFYNTTLTNYIENLWDIKLLGICGQLISIVETLHSSYIVHSDIKPDNFMIDANGRVVIIDFGLASLFYNVDKKIHRPNKPSEHLIGSPKYASVHLHTGNSVSCRDDLISLGYMMMTLFHIDLPWANIQADEFSELPLYHIEHPANIERAKHKQFDALMQCLKSHYATHYLIPYFHATYSLAYEDSPDYKMLGQIFSTLY